MSALGKNLGSYEEKKQFAITRTTQVMTIREAMFSSQETIPTVYALGRVCRVPTVSCPPAIPIAIPGELIDEPVLKVFEYYGIENVDVVLHLN